jgi:hypothetical protein
MNIDGGQMFFKLKNIVLQVWEKFKTLKRWQKIVVVIIVVSILIPSANDSKVNVEKSATMKKDLVPTPNSTPSVEVTPTPSVSQTPNSQLEFRFSALRDLGDIRKDVSDARVGITQNGLGKFYWNVAEININMVQLEILLPRDEYAKKWNEKLEILKSAIDDLGQDDEDLTISKAKIKLNKVLNALPALENIARSLAN